MHLRTASTPHGLSIEFRRKQRNKTENKFQQTEPVTITRRSLTWWNHTRVDSVRASRTWARSLGYRCIVKEAPPSRTSWWLPKTKIQSRSKVESSTDINVTGWIVMRNILESPQELLEKGSRNIWNPPPIYDHSNISGHNVTINNFNIVGREDLNQMRTIKEALYIRVNDPSLNRNVGKYHLPHVWDEVLFNTSELNWSNWPCGFSIYHWQQHLPPHNHPAVVLTSATWQ